MTNEVQVIVYRVGAEPVLEKHPDTLATWQGIVGGYIEALGLPDGLLLICDEDGKAKRSPVNRVLVGVDTIVGDFFVVRSKGEEFADCKPQDIEFLQWKLL
jgi:hypothetical protein